MWQRIRRLLETGGEKKQRVVAVALRQGKILAVGYNSYTKSHELQRRVSRLAHQDEKKYLHAEVAALLRCRVTPDTLMVARISRRGELVNSKPCDCCRIAINLVNPKMRVIHT